MRRKQLLPGQHNRRGIVSAPVAVEEGGSLRGHVDYLVETGRHEGMWSLEIQWVDLNKQGNRVQLPHEVVSLIFRQADLIIKACCKERAQHAAETRKSKRTEIPPVFLED